MANGNGKWQMPTAECKIGANRNLSKDLAMFHADFTLARSHTLAGQRKLVAKSIFQYNRKSSAVSATSGVPLLFFFFVFVWFFFYCFLWTGRFSHCAEIEEIEESRRKAWNHVHTPRTHVCNCDATSGWSIPSPTANRRPLSFSSTAAHPAPMHCKKLVVLLWKLSAPIRKTFKFLNYVS